MKALVTGGAGFIGSQVAAGLLARGVSVRVLDNFATGHRRNLVALGAEAEVVEGDVRSYQQVQGAVGGCDIVFHQAALSSIARSIQDPLTSHATNVAGTLNVLLAARDNGVRRVVLASSSSVYGAATRLPVQEDHPTVPISPYAAAKLAGEHYAQIFHRVYGLETVVLRYFNVFGPRQDARSQYAAVVPRFIAAFLEGGQPVIFGDGEQSRDFTPVANVVRANILASEALNAAGRVYNVACGTRVSVNALACEIGGMLGREVRPVYAAPRAGEVSHTFADLARAREELGYEPLVQWRAGLGQTIAYVRDHEPSSRNWSAPCFEDT